MQSSPLLPKRSLLTGAMLVLAGCTSPSNGPRGEPGPKGEAGVVGASGLNCWDLNGNDGCDLDAEDANADSACNVLDCRGNEGPAGPRGPQGPGSGRIVYHQLMTGPWLEANATMGSNRGRSLTNARLDFGPGASDGEILFTVPLVPGDLLDPSHSYMLKITCQLFPVSADNDFFLGVQDDSTFVGFYKLDATNGSHGEIMQDEAPVNGTYTMLATTGPPTFTARRFELTYYLSDTTTVVADLGPTVDGASAVAATALQRDEDLTLAVYANNAAEQYGFHLINVMVTQLE